MADFKKINWQMGRQSTLVVAGLLAAASCFAMLATGPLQDDEKAGRNPVTLKVLADARKHRSKGRWKEAAMLLKDHALPNNPEILLNYAKLLSRGWGVDQDLDKAREKLLLAVQQDFPKRGEAAYELGRVYRQSIGPDCKRIAFEWFVEASKVGHMQAHAELGRHYSRGIGVAVDMQRALDHYRVAARFGAANSLVSFVQKLSKNENPTHATFDLEKIIDEAIPALEKEAVSGRGSSAKVLGRLYRDGIVVKADPAMALVWFERGVRLADTGSMVELAKMLFEENKDGDNVGRALTLLGKAAALRNLGALTELGRLHLTGQFGLNPANALELFQSSAKAGHPGGMLELARMLLAGDGLPKNRKKALGLLKRSAATGHLGSQKLLAKLHHEMEQSSTKANSASSNKVSSALPAKGPLVKQPKSQLQQLRIKVRRLKRREELRRASGTTNPTGKTKALTGATVITPFGKQS